MGGHKFGGIKSGVSTFRSSTGGVSALGRINHFVDPGVKVNGQYYRDILLTRDILPDIKQYSDYFTFQQDVAPAHRARETVELLKVETPDFILQLQLYYAIQIILIKHALANHIP